MYHNILIILIISDTGKISHADQNSIDLTIFHFSDFLMYRGMSFANYTDLEDYGITDDDFE